MFGQRIVRQLGTFRPIVNVPALYQVGFYQFLGPKNIIRTHLPITVPNSLQFAFAVKYQDAIADLSIPDRHRVIYEYIKWQMDDDKNDDELPPFLL